MELGLDRVSIVAERLALTRPPFRVISVAGTNGKGSTVAMLQAILHTAGYRVGSYTSPHMLRYNERVCIGADPVSDAQLCAVFELIEQTRLDTPLTYFEFGTLAALQLFAQQGIDVAILEVGLGGRLDAVNVVDADAAIVTSVGTDHTHWLGQGREQIGREKAGIFRRARPAICADPDPPASVRELADAIGARFLQIGDDFRIERESASWRWRSRQQLRAGLPYPAMRGDYQVRNASAALMALETLSEYLPVTQAQVRDGLLTAFIPGRFQTLPGRPVRVLDVAHNVEAAAALAETLKTQPVLGKTAAVLGILRDKPIERVLSAMAPVVARWYLTTLATERGAGAEELLAVLKAMGLNASASLYPDPRSAYRAACSDAGKSDRVVVFGSFYTVSDILSDEHLRG
jgi:dihydrofolate synthase/folylpolyglutamate synthase